MEDVQQLTAKNSKKRFMSPVTKGYFAMGLVLMVWSGFAFTARAVGASQLAIADVALIRFFVPMVMLIPLVRTHFTAIKNVRFTDILFVLLGGIPFLFLAILGAQTAPTAYVGTILAGSPPLFVALLIYVFYRQKTSLKRGFSLAIILMGIVTMIIAQGGSTTDDMKHGIGFLLCASLSWAGYTIGLKRAQLAPFTVAIILSYLSFFITLGLILLKIVPTNFGAFSFQDALPYLLVQGVGVGVIATLAYSYAVNQLGSSRTSVIGSVSPGLTALLAIPIFGESLSLGILCGIVFTAVGAILSNRC